MSGRFFLDTNIFAYSFDTRSPAKAKLAAELIRRAADTGEGIISFQVLQEFLNVALRCFPQPLSAAEAEQYLVVVLRLSGRVAPAPGSAFVAGALSRSFANYGETPPGVV